MSSSITNCFCYNVLHSFTGLLSKPKSSMNNMRIGRPTEFSKIGIFSFKRASRTSGFMLNTFDTMEWKHSILQLRWLQHFPDKVETSFHDFSRKEFYEAKKINLKWTQYCGIALKPLLGSFGSIEVELSAPACIARKYTAIQFKYFST